MSDPGPLSETTAPLGALACPKCGAAANAGDLFCEVDGTRLGEPLPARAGGCACGAAEDDGDGYCGRCGHKINLNPDLTSGDHEEIAIAPNFGAVTDRGVRHHDNEDAVALARETVNGEMVYVLVVCDGVSSSSDADQASAIAARTARDALLEYALTGDGSGREQVMSEAILSAHREACERAPHRDPGQDPPGTTIVAALVQRGEVTLGWVGDSRAYWLGPENGAVLPEAGLLSRDHSWLNEVVDSGEMTEAEALRDRRAHMLTHCLGPLEQIDEERAPTPQTASFTPPPGCRLLLCSDGLWNYASRPEEIARLVQALPPGAEAVAVARNLTQYALDCGGRDNITVALIYLP